MKIINGSVFLEDGKFDEVDVVCKDGLISDIGQDITSSSDTEIFDASDCYVIPGLCDIHLHGCMSFDSCDGTKEALAAMAKYEASVGVTSILPTTMTYPEKTLTTIAKAVADYRKYDNNTEGFATIHGINMEGPFISPEKKGAQNPKYIQNPDYDMFHRINVASGNSVRLCDIAPETDGAMEFIDKAKDETRISLAHTTADYDTCKEAFKRGAKHLTHLFNAMPAFTHRAPGPIGAAAENEDVTPELICDGVHVYPAAVNMMYKVFGADRLIMISDSMRATGLPDGEYELGGQPVIVRGRRATLHDGTIAGSATNLFDCMMTAVKEMNIPLADAILCASRNPARAIGVYDTVGSITIGKQADFVIINKSDLSIKKVIVRGKYVNS
ncbi:N-acetylglucosamine-6-phosphate deacetylase [Pseudobutyrivibrio ruminis]|uniref:N-acetylglucosamine-6-phosphate deacetylase n=1 Tax=Pseudobutyrivibrio ruminis DSM 9787 TaxID=1123011 RepID=A0A285TB81_9FIRM|nr:N-acetylglucosamine-6-phosphate deacetylase [Pseudobutyrivibrio ruminis]SOC17031.1 N-acetylglucosamine-6-phosphate deacetylase [Pseudobutyrivibrio ruminis DSM 9787]